MSWMSWNNRLVSHGSDDCEDQGWCDGLYMLCPGSGTVEKRGLVDVGSNTLVLVTWEPVIC